MSDRRRATGPYADGSEDQPMFSMPPCPASRTGEQGRGAPTVGWGHCPGCTPRDNPASTKQVALKAAGAHLAWASHTRGTALGRVIPCMGSAQRLCVRPPVDGRLKRRLTRRQRDGGVPEIIPWRCRCGKHGGTQ